MEVESSLNWINLFPDLHSTFPLFWKRWVVSKPFEHLIQLLFDFCPTFVRRWSNECRAKVETVRTLHPTFVWLLPDIVRRWSNESRAKVKTVRTLHPTFVWLLLDIRSTLIEWMSGKSQNRLNTSSNFCATFARHSFDAGRMNVGQKSNRLNRSLLVSTK